MRRVKLRGGAIALAMGMAGNVATAADLEVTISGVKNDHGKIRISLYNGPEGFRHEEKSAQTIEQPAVVGTVSARFENLAPGRYALIAYHDENSDGTMNRLLGMIPTEGYGLSNNPKVMGPPKFDAAAVQIDESMSLEIRLNY